ISRLIRNRRKPLYQAVFTTSSSHRRAKTALRYCIKDGSFIEMMIPRLIQFGDYLVRHLKRVQNPSMGVQISKGINKQLLFNDFDFLCICINSW
ncbi:MAG: hypothetical protein FWF15_11100, partial [Oscillospiraceae bacterium]|nr:hypothetical protein [Oscillospiraceae bacterium]